MKMKAATAQYDSKDTEYDSEELPIQIQLDILILMLCFLTDMNKKASSQRNFD